jgi:hypothetical protein
MKQIKQYEEKILTITKADFEFCFNRTLKNQEEWDDFIHYIKNGVDAQLEWNIIYIHAKNNMRK